MNQKEFLLDIERLLGSTSKIKLLKKLYQYRNIEHSIRFLAKEAKISVNQAKLIIDLYKELGIINYRQSGSSVLVNLKVDTVYFKLIEKIINYNENIKDELIKDMIEKISNIKANIQLWIFGSFARNKLNNDSDIDILIIFKDKNQLEQNKQNLLNMQNELSSKYIKNFSFLIVTKAEYEKDYKALHKNVLFEGEKIYG